MYLVSDLMTRELVTVLPGDDLGMVDAILGLGRYRHLPVVDEGGHLVGLVTHRDLLRAFAERGASASRTVPAREVMTTQVTTVRPEATLRHALKLMTHHRFGCLPVVDGNGVLLGLITEFDLVKFAAHFVADLDEVSQVAAQSG